MPARASTQRISINSTRHPHEQAPGIVDVATVSGTDSFFCGFQYIRRLDVVVNHGAHLVPVKPENTDKAIVVQARKIGQGCTNTIAVQDALESLNFLFVVIG